MKHRVTNFGSEPIRVRTGHQLTEHDTVVAPGAVYEGEVGSIHHGGGRIHYSVRPAERQAGYAAFGAEDDE